MENVTRNKVARYRIRCFVSPTHNVPITCSLVVGLIEMSKHGEIELNMSRLMGDTAARNIVRIDVTDVDDESTCRICVDISDRSDLFCLKSLELVDVYFKRNYWTKSTAALPHSLAAKVQPAGVTFGCYIPGSRGLLVKSAFMSFIGRFNARHKFPAKNSVKRLLSDLDQIRCFLPRFAWERSPDDQVIPRIVFQTRVWRGHLKSELDRTDVNESRISLTRALRDSFGFEDTVGLLDSPSSRELAPDAILSRKVTRAEYAHQLRTSLIAVNSHGLDGSAGFKVAEALAAGCAIVSEPLKVQLPVPFEAGVHYLPYDTPEQCVAQCRYLLNNPVIAEEMRATNLDYYRKYVSPPSLARQLLGRVFETRASIDGQQLRVDQAACGID